MKKIEINQMELIEGGGYGATTVTILGFTALICIGAIGTGIGAGPALGLVVGIINHYESGCLK